ncbi:hypothetical protein JJL45_12075 [Tamlana sp. s12]|uniref:SwmB domain-containing protein n=1 Tax=Tamlana sp. s12 TaxID=1630406 RepID=UPI0007FC4F1A|nr:SwmB domain-containing protein [Tamlana sp. s12]OBQ56695.1 hypothetical protein VQ01_05010 [Tamlana sp. s12]QQY81659.1 hypothetical protein JJL45_12075 [Tamlana sp. s12]
MKLNKNIAKYLFIAALGFTACNEEDDLQLQEPSERVIYTSQMDFDNQIEVGSFLTFGDVSPGVSSRTWTFPENVTNVEGATSSEDIVKAYFNTAGVFDVTLHQVFKKDAYVDQTLMGKELDTTIVVTVLEPIDVSVTANYINPDGTIGGALSLAENANNELQAGRSIRYTYTAVGAPTSTTWSFEGGKPGTMENTEIVDVKYSRMGEFGIELVAGRDRPFGEFSLVYDNLITVIPSTDPVTLDAVYNADSSGGILNLEFSREIEPSTVDLADFTVTASNGGTVVNPMIANASVDVNEGNIVVLTLGDVVYNDDQVTVSYTPGTLKTLDEVAVDAITDSPMVFVGENIFDNGIFDYSFERTSDISWVFQNWDLVPWKEYDFSVSSAHAYEGDFSGYAEVHANGGMIVGQEDGDKNAVTFHAEAGKSYELGVWIYVESLGTINAGVNPPDVRFYWFPDTNWGVAGNPTFTVDYQVGQWVYSSQIVSFFETGEKTISIRADNQNNPEPLKFYMDNLTLIEANLRP